MASSKKAQELHAALESNIGEGGSDGESSSQSFVHLHAHSAYSLLEGALPLKQLLELAVADNQPALAVTDRNNLFGALEFSEKAVKEGLQPIMGAKVAVDFCDGKHHKPRSGLVEYPFLVLLASNETGFGNIRVLISRAHLQSDAGDLPHVTMEDVLSHSEGVICLTGGRDGPLYALGLENRKEDVYSRLAELKKTFGDRLYVELQRHDARDRQVERLLVPMAYEADLPLVATNQPFFATRDDFEAHDALVCIEESTVVAVEDRKRLTEEHYFKSKSEMIKLFKDLPEAIDNTIEISKRCSYREVTRAPILPIFTEGAEGASKEEAVQAESDELKRQARNGLKDRLEKYPLAEGHTREDYDKRLEFELNVIEQMQYPGYFLIVADFIKWSKEQGIPVGPGRGSGAGSLVAWALTITDIDPMQFSLLFERFLNPDRISMPDFDIDFCQERREEVIRYVQEKYGADQVAQIITFGSLQARAVLRDVGRVLQMPYGQVDKLCKMVPNNPANPTTLIEAIDGEPRLQEAAKEEEIVSQLFDISKKLEGLFRHASTHAAGIVIGDRELDKLVPLYRDPRSDMPVTQYNMKWVEQAGLVKFDFLGLKTLTVLEKSVGFIAQRGIEIDLAHIPLDDEKTFDMLTRGETVGVFQLESQGMRKALVGMRPDRFTDIIALVALYRPGPMDNIPTYNARKHGEEYPDYYHPKIEPVLKETYGVIIYQEQVMQIAQILSGYSLGEADLLRRAMGKKIASEMEAQRVRFVDGAVERDLAKGEANMIFDLLAKFANYGFNKSHAAAYALVSYQTAYLKANYPVEFLAGSMQLDLGNTDKLGVFYQEARSQDIPVVPPSVQTSRVGFSVKDGKIYYALAAIKGVGEGAVEQIVREREENGEYVSIEDFFSRIDIKQVNKRTLENLICAGAFDCFSYPRERMLAGLERLVAHASRTAQDRESGQNDMFGAAMSGEEQKIDLPLCEAWSAGETLNREFQAVGFYLSAHPLDEYKQILEKMRIQQFADFEHSVKNGATAGRLAGTITSRQERKTRQGKAMGIVLISDPSGQYEAVIFEEGLNRFRDDLVAGQSVILQVGADMRDDAVSVRINSVEPLEKAASREERDMTIFMRDEEPLQHLPGLLSKRGNGRVSLIVIQNNGQREIELQLPDRYQVSSKVQSAIKAIPGVLEVEVA
ncbi:MAG: DNA polymerase III subunit alpha [Rhizobiaceae bacterium]|nr:DNA polymerase III subunit alpha [Rhizobiaceae bacterium]